jgi:hypothetical protein
MDIYRCVFNGRLSKDEWQKVESQAQEIYQDLVNKRQELGLGEFDNSVPESVKKYFEGMGGYKYYEN